ncbi:MAG: hypothetical protein WCS98_06830 [Bacillota bacterium]|nr:hypothetical protein [Bacillota bacterium]MDD3298450.1 hypothetical protein [Bacillota bacterium]MDD3850785.1 hypothetical protein [Bacillota bacterium]MDD4707300.1 hypothetical protein [Bacillota bacterium]
MKACRIWLRDRHLVIAARQGISESLLYKHFKRIDDVLVAVVESFSRYDSMIKSVIERAQAEGEINVRKLLF